MRYYFHFLCLFLHNSLYVLEHEFLLYYYLHFGLEDISKDILTR